MAGHIFCERGGGAFSILGANPKRGVYSQGGGRLLERVRYSLFYYISGFIFHSLCEHVMNFKSE